MGGKISAGFMTQQIRPVVIHRVKPSFIDNVFFFPGRKGVLMIRKVTDY